MMMRTVAHVLQACTVLVMLGSAVAIAAKPAAPQSAPQSGASKPLALGETETPREEHFAYCVLATKGIICVMQRPR